MLYVRNIIIIIYVLDNTYNNPGKQSDNNNDNNDIALKCEIAKFLTKKMSKMGCTRTCVQKFDFSHRNLRTRRRMQLCSQDGQKMWVSPS
jgi:hypothetical protein